MRHARLTDVNQEDLYALVVQATRTFPVTPENARGAFTLEQARMLAACAITVTRLVSGNDAADLAELRRAIHARTRRRHHAELDAKLQAYIDTNLGNYSQVMLFIGLAIGQRLHAPGAEQDRQGRHGRR
jgi:hypothetical protein